MNCRQNRRKAGQSCSQSVGQVRFHSCPACCKDRRSSCENRRGNYERQICPPKPPNEAEPIGFSK